MDQCGKKHRKQLKGHVLLQNGTSGISYKVYEKCPKLLLWLRRVWGKKASYNHTGRAEGCILFITGMYHIFTSEGSRMTLRLQHAPISRQESLTIWHLEPCYHHGKVIAEIRNLEEEQRKARTEALRSQGTWTRWALTKRKLTWTDLWRQVILELLLAEGLPTPVQVGHEKRPYVHKCNPGTHPVRMQHRTGPRQMC